MYNAFTGYGKLWVNSKPKVLKTLVTKLQKRKNMFLALEKGHKFIMKNCSSVASSSSALNNVT